MLYTLHCKAVATGISHYILIYIFILNYSKSFFFFNDSWNQLFIPKKFQNTISIGILFVAFFW